MTKLQMLVSTGHCLEMTGAADRELMSPLPRPRQTSPDYELMHSDQRDSSLTCRLLWPISGSLISFSSTNPHPQVLVSCQGSEGIELQALRLYVSLGDVLILIRHIIIFFDSADSGKLGKNHNKTFLIEGNFPVAGDEFNHLRSIVTRNASVEIELQNTLLATSFPIIVLFPKLVPIGLVSYGANALLGTKPISLQSQLLFPGYLNDRSISGTGLALCCDTVKGMSTIFNLIDSWEGDSLVNLSQLNLNFVQNLTQLNPKVKR